MKHAAVLYTCIGLMGAAAITGFVDYTQASNAGTLSNLYKEELPTTGSTLIAEKEIDLEDYSRAALEEQMANDQQEETIAEKPKPKKPKKTVPPPPPPPKQKKTVTVEVVEDVPVAPPAEPEVIVEKVAPTPSEPPAPVVEVKAEEPPTPATEEVKSTRITPRIFSRAPLPPKVNAVKKKKRS